MSKFMWIFIWVLAVEYTHSYILLTANLEDVHEIVKQIASSPVASTLNKIFRRASNLFRQQVGTNETQKRANEKFDDTEQITERKDSRIKGSGEDYQVSDGETQKKRRSNRDEELVALGKNASNYLQIMKQIFENAKTN